MLDFLTRIRKEAEVNGPMEARQDGVYKTLLRSRPVKLPLVDNKGRLNVETHGAPKRSLYWGDLFHTLVNMPNPRFLLVLTLTYTILFGGFALPYYYDAYNNFCVPGVITFSHALWFSVQTSMTIGYGGELTPDPECMMTNTMVVIQSLFSLIVAYSLLGVFYVRFARPARRAQTLIFSKHMVMYEEDGMPVLAFRMANVRKHQIIEAHVRVLIGLNSHLTDEDESMFQFTALPVVGGSQVFLGLPSTVKHPITSTSPLFGLTVEDMERFDTEILVLLEGVDASTSSKLQARHSYLPKDIVSEHRFETMVTRTNSGRRAVDFSKFDTVVPVTSNVSTRPGTSCLPSPAISALRLPGAGMFASGVRFAVDPAVQQANWDLDAREFDNDRDVRSATSSPDSVASSAEGRDKLTRLRIDIPKRARDPFQRKTLVRSMPDLLDSETEDEDGDLCDKSQRDLEERVIVAEARANTFKLMVIELASGIQQTLQQPTSAAQAEAGSLVASARQALSFAMKAK